MGSIGHCLYKISCPESVEYSLLNFLIRLNIISFLWQRLQHIACPSALSIIRVHPHLNFVFVYGCFDYTNQYLTLNHFGARNADGQNIFGLQFRTHFIPASWLANEQVNKWQNVFVCLLVFRTEDGSSRFLWNVGIFLQVKTAPQPRISRPNLHHYVSLRSQIMKQFSFMIHVLVKCGWLKTFCFIAYNNLV